MSITPVPITGFPGPGFPVTTITPLTYRDGMTYLQKMETLRRWVQVDLVTWMETEVNGLSDAWTDEVTALVTQVNTALTAQAEQVNTALSEQDAEVDQKIQDLTDYVNQKVQEIIDGSIGANDQVVTQLIQDPNSGTSDALEARYQAINTVSNTAVAGTVTGNGPTRDALDAAYVNANETIDVQHGGTGRTTNATPFGVITAGAGVTDPLTTVDPATAGYVLTSGGAGAAPTYKQLVDDASTATTRVLSASKTYAVIDGKTLSGTYAARPAATAVRAGTIYVCTDIPEMFMSTGAAWIVAGAGGNEVGYAQTDSSTVTSSTTLITGSPVQYPGLITTFIVGERPILLSCTGRLAHATAGQAASLQILLDEAVKIQADQPMATADVWGNVKTEVTVRGLVPGSTHTARVTFGPVSSGTARATGGASNISVRTV